MSRVVMSRKVARIKSKLEWAVSSQDFSVMISPDDSEILLKIIADYYTRLEAT